MNKIQLSKEIKRWKDFYIKRGIPPKLYEIYLNYATPLLEKDLPVIYDFEHLYRLLGINKSLLAAMVNSPEAFYRTFSIPKRSGGVRTITAPHESLKTIQSWIYSNILAKTKVSKCAHGFMTKRSIVTNAQCHVHKKYLLKLDLQDFFPSIPKSFVVQVFHKFGYTNRVSGYLSSICCYEECLPQGAPTSPMLCNIIAFHMDNRLNGLAKSYYYKYTRYADDLAFSGTHISISFVDKVSKIIEECGFRLNKNKIRLYNERGSKILTGVSIANGKLSLPRDYRRSLTQELYYIQRYGLNGHVRHNKIKNPHYLESMLGKVNYWLMIEPNNENAQMYRDYLSRIYKQKFGL